MSNQPPRKKLKQSKITSFIRQSYQQVDNESSDKMQKARQIPMKCSFSKADDKVVIEMPSDLDSPFAEQQTYDRDKNELNYIIEDAHSSNNDEASSINENLSIFSNDARGSVSSSSMKGYINCTKKSFESFKGYSLDSFTRLSYENLCLPKLQHSENHDIFVNLPLPERGAPVSNSITEDIWDDTHVKMPNSPQSLYHNILQNGKLIERWAVICEALSVKITSVGQLKDAILSYNHRYKQKWSFNGIENLLEKELCEEEHNYFFEYILPGIIRLALDLPSIVSMPIPLLLRGKTHSLSLSQKQVASLMANAFLCTFPRRNVKGSHSDYATFPDINFSRLFNHQDKKAYEKLKCIIHYFKEISNKDPDGMITFTRQCIHNDDLPDFEASCKVLPKLHIDSKGLIEEADGLLQVDFANKYIGGGVLGLGCVQEEIRFVIYPELIITRLFTEVLSSNEVLIVTGAERFNDISGYASTFQWERPHYDITPCDSSLRRLCQLVCIDATNFTRNVDSQYQRYYIMRELKKAYVGYCSINESAGIPSAVATGNWGCGAFRGNPILKGLIQLAAAAEANRDVTYFTFGDDTLKDKLYDIYIFLESSSVTIGELVRLLYQYDKRKNCNDDIPQYIKNRIFSAYNSDTDTETA